MYSQKETKMLSNKASRVTANNDVVYLWWSFPQKIEGCLGYSIHRLQEGKNPVPLPAAVGFSAEKDPRKAPQTTDIWPIQSFNWKDLYAPSNQPIKYKIIPMIGTWDKLQALDDEAIETDLVVRTAEYGKARIIFNRGLLSTQAFSKAHGDPIDLLKEKGGEWRNRLGGQLLTDFNFFFSLAKSQGGNYYAALYELTDIELMSHLTDNKDTEIILSNANSTEASIVEGVKKTKSINDGTNKPQREILKKMMIKGTLKVYDRMLGSHIGHNKFVIYVDKNGKPQRILTGSTNWTATGLCGQTNNLVIINDDHLAEAYMEYWERLKADAKQDELLRIWCREHPISVDRETVKYKLWFAPNTAQKNKPANAEMPVDIKDVFSLIETAKHSILFLVFNPGSPSIINKIREVAGTRADTNPLFIRGAISDAKIAKQVITEIYSTSGTKKPDRYKVGDEKITGVAAIPGSFSYWEKELLKLGFATIHDKILVIDPFDNDCIVVTGSHNLGYKASYTNDENMLMIKGQTNIAKAYATHILDVVNHFKWRYRLQSHMTTGMSDKQKRKVLESMWKDLSEEPTWQDYYYGPQGFIDQYRLFLR